jgi:hypothetical protein
VGHKARLSGRKRWRRSDSSGAGGGDEGEGISGGLGPTRGGPGPPGRWWVFHPQWVELNLGEYNGRGAHDLLADQQVNSRFVSEVWKLGMDIKDVCDRVTVAKMVNDLMVEKREEFLKLSVEMSRLARESVSEGGSTYSNLDRLIDDIRLMNVSAKC